jgi:hypothetical protein
MSFLRGVSLARSAAPRSFYCTRNMSVSAIIRDVNTPTKTDSAGSRDLVQEQKDRQSNATLADIVNDAPSTFSAKIEVDLWAPG